MVLYILFSFLFVLVIGILVIFSFPQFSPIPYFPSNKKDLTLIINALNMRDSQNIIDLGAGDGVVIFAASHESFRKKLTTQFYAVEINPVLLIILWVKRFFHPNRAHVHIIKQDMFTCTYSDFINVKNTTTFYLYISPWFLSKTIQNIRKQFKNFDIVSYFYRIQNLTSHGEKRSKGVHNLYEYYLRRESLDKKGE